MLPVTISIELEKDYFLEKINYYEQMMKQPNFPEDTYASIRADWKQFEKLYKKQLERYSREVVYESVSNTYDTRYARYEVFVSLQENCCITLYFSQYYDNDVDFVTIRVSPEIYSQVSSFISKLSNVSLCELKIYHNKDDSVKIRLQPAKHILVGDVNYDHIIWIDSFNNHPMRLAKTDDNLFSKTIENFCNYLIRIGVNKIYVGDLLIDKQTTKSVVRKIQEQWKSVIETIANVVDARIIFLNEKDTNPKQRYNGNRIYLLQNQLIHADVYSVVEFYQKILNLRLPYRILDGIYSSWTDITYNVEVSLKSGKPKVNIWEL